MLTNPELLIQRKWLKCQRESIGLSPCRTPLVPLFKMLFNPSCASFPDEMWSPANLDSSKMRKIKMLTVFFLMINPLLMVALSLFLKKSTSVKVTFLYGVFPTSGSYRLDESSDQLYRDYLQTTALSRKRNKSFPYKKMLIFPVLQDLWEDKHFVGDSILTETHS